MIRATGLHRTYPPDREVLRGIELEVAAGAFVSIAGRSGSGKTTLLNIVGGLDSEYRGTVEIAGLVLGELTDAALSSLRNSTIGYVFQAYHLLEHLTVAENAALAALFARGDRFRSSRDVQSRARQVLGEVGLVDRANDRPGALSGGERQRLALARALFHRPTLLLCDEPTGNLDLETGAEVVALLSRIHRAGGMTVLVTSHDEAVSEVAEVRMRLEDGVLRSGS